MAQLDPSVWQSLPRDIVYYIIEQSDLTTQINWSAPAGNSLHTPLLSYGTHSTSAVSRIFDLESIS